jgi:rhodanese-related sulfurtransferase
MIAPITTDELRQMMDRGDPFSLVEILPEECYRAGHLPGAIQLTPDRVQELAPIVLPDRSIEVVVYCGSFDCHAAEQAARTLDSLGYRMVREYREGKENWVQAGWALELTGPSVPF